MLLVLLVMSRRHVVIRRRLVRHGGRSLAAQSKSVKQWRRAKLRLGTKEFKRREGRRAAERKQANITGPVDLTIPSPWVRARGRPTALTSLPQRVISSVRPRDPSMLDGPIARCAQRWVDPCRVFSARPPTASNSRSQGHFLSASGMTPAPSFTF